MSLVNKKTELLRRFINKLKDLPYVDESYVFSYYSLEAANMLEDTFYIDLKDYMQLIKLRGSIQIDKDDTIRIATDIMYDHRIWFEKNDFREEFNNTLDLLNNKMYCPEYVDTIHNITVKDSNKYFYDSIPVLIVDTTIVQKDTLISFTYENCSKDIPFPLKVLKYEVIISSEITSEMLHKQIVTSYDELRLHERDLMIRKIKEDSIYQSKTLIIRDLHAGLEKLIDRIRN